MEQIPIESKPLATEREREIFFRISSGNQLELIAIADNKANMITALNTILIAITIALFSSGFTLQDSPIFEKLEIALPLGVLAVFCAVSAVCSILALKPKIIRAKQKSGKNMMFFHNFYRKSLKEYRQEVEQVLTSQSSIYDQLISYTYHNGLVLERKYQLLSFSYTLFLLAILLSGTAFIVVSMI